MRKKNHDRSPNYKSNPKKKKTSLKNQQNPNARNTALKTPRILLFQLPDSTLPINLAYFPRYPEYGRTYVPDASSHTRTPTATVSA